VKAIALGRRKQRSRPGPLGQLRSIASDKSGSWFDAAPIVGRELSIDVFEQLVAPKVEALIRRSSLRTSDDQPVSRNLVVALCHHDEALGPVFTGLERPIGRGLGAQGLGRARRILGAGEADWVDAGGARRPCAFKAYVLERAGEPVAYLHERFNPDFVPLEG
jgi:hypothetical protein